ncbi:hypothetical protein CGCF415_v011006 [Colletotrichum fructicola]|nr:hypothetical protein CGCF415_v011006 [Colletotrichum fructicola]KAF4937384.1 hypothetical protein CGCF245_v005612 [Colletotrichum fructicola]
MNPLTALGLVANIVPFIEIAANVLRTAKEIHDSESGGLEDNVNLEKYATQPNQHYSNLLAPDSADLVGEDKELCALAAECRKLAQDLLDVLERIKPTDRSSKWQSLRSAVKNMWRSKDKEILEKRLELCRTQVEAQLNHKLSTKIVVALKRLLEATGQDAGKLKQIKSYVEDLREGVQVTSLSKEVQNQVSQLINVPDAVTRQVAIESFLGGLAFDGMHERFDAIGNTRCSTWAFVWMGDKDYDPLLPANGHNDKKYPKSFERLHLAVEERHRRRHRQLFADWLSFGEGIFHMSAKLGAGKSTLLWQLCDNLVIRHRLLGWAGERKLAMGKFFFWNYGTRLQKSLAGLSRALLFDIFQSFPELISRAFASRWEEALAVPWQTRRALILADKECIEGLELLIAESSKQDFSHRFCFFIDALNELQETPEFTFRDLSRILKSWAQASGGNVKFCVSSREYPQFMDEFTPEARMRLHELTKQDMISFVQCRLESYFLHKSQTDELVLAIVEKAQGVFLWVILVAKEVTEMICCGYHYEDVLQQIDSLPHELEALFMHAIGTITRQDRLEAYKVFLLMIEASRWDLDLIIADFVFLKLYEKDPRPDFFLQHKSRPSYFIKSQLDECSRRLFKCCKGLIEIGHDFRVVRFNHRSVQEFLLQPDIQTMIKKPLPSFDIKETLSQIICLAQ